MEGEWEESGDDEEEMNDYQDSPEQQNSHFQVCSRIVAVVMHLFCLRVLLYLYLLIDYER